MIETKRNSNIWFDQFLFGSKIDKRYSGHVLKVKNLGISMVFLCSVALFGLICGKLQLPGSSITFFWLNQARQPKHIEVKLFLNPLFFLKNLCRWHVMRKAI